MNAIKEIKHDEEVVFVYAIVRAQDWSKVSFPPGSFAKAMEIGKASELCNMDSCRGWGAMMGISLAKLAKRSFPEIFKILNPEKSPIIQAPQ